MIIWPRIEINGNADSGRLSDLPTNRHTCGRAYDVTRCQGGGQTPPAQGHHGL